MMNNKKIISFLVLTFLWSWTFWFIGLEYLSIGIDQESIDKFIMLFFVGVYGPTLSAIINTLIFDGYHGFRDLLKRLFYWKVSLWIYLYVIFLPIIFVIIGVFLYARFIGSIGSFDIMAFISIPTVLWAGFYAGPLGEELGWRGFLLPELQTSLSGLKSALIIGFIWFIWHIPLFWAPFGTLVSGEPFSILSVLTYLIMIICLSIIITWLVNNAKGSVLIAILFHLSINAGIALLFFPELNTSFKTVHLLSSIGMLIFTVIILFQKNWTKTQKSNY